MGDSSAASKIEKKLPWWRCVGPALITACVVFGPGSLLISSKVGAEHGYKLLWLLILTGILMGTYVTMAARVGVMGGATPCTLVANRSRRWFAAIIGINLCLICTAFQFSNNLAVAAAADTLGVARLFGDPAQMSEGTKALINSGVLLLFNVVIITLVFTLRHIYKILERGMKAMVAVILICFLVNLLVVGPNPLKIVKGLIPRLPDRIERRLIFNVAGDVRKDLDSERASGRLREEFAQHDRRVTPQARISVKQPGQKWLIKDHTKEYTVTKEGGILHVRRGKLLFSMSDEYQAGLNKGVVSPELRAVFDTHEEPLSTEARITIDENGDKWLIRDRTGQNSGPSQTKAYTLLKEGDMLSVYEGIAFVAPLLLVASLLGTTFSVAGAFYQGNLVREKGWTLKDYESGFRDAVAGVSVLTGVSAMIMITSATVLRDAPASDIGVLAMQLRPLLGKTSHVLFCIGLLAVAMNPFVINAMIGGSILADGLGKPPRLSDPWSRRFTVAVLLVGMAVAMLVLHTPVQKVDAIVFGQALTVVGNPLMAATLLWLANRKDIMGDRRNGVITNVFGVLGLVVVVVMAGRILLRLIH
jgi:Mn2+/Fe2+ NRAMP family transporter